MSASRHRAQKGDTNVTDRAVGGLVAQITLIYRPPAMKRLSLLPFVLLGLSFVWGCGDDGRPSGSAGNDSTLVGAPCMNNDSCDERLCQSGPSFPGGVCTLSCGSSNHCPSGSSCAQLESGWLCLVNCTATADCREQWSCESVIEAGTNDESMVSVCFTPAPAS